MQHEPTQLLVIDEDDSTHAIIPILEQCGYKVGASQRARHSDVVE
jgi:hypothetical protein